MIGFNTIRQRKQCVVFTIHMRVSVKSLLEASLVWAKAQRWFTTRYSMFPLVSGSIRGRYFTGKENGSMPLKRNRGVVAVEDRGV
jgi:hypothetical protein